MFPLHTRFLGFGCVVVTPGLVSRNDAFQKCGILLITHQVLETEAHSLFLMIKGKVLWYPISTHFTVLQMLVNDGVNCFLTQVEIVTDVTGPNSSISSNHFINGGNRVVGDHDVCLARCGQIRYRLPPFTKILHQLFTAVRPKQCSP
ncbi:hypothetical protein AVEN_128781-1 [Araneus ventricosus]|uniref:Uncharacterized protein n=1 Tax=Araneus ventricosus TaxID=182803 RepID=A0A4Y2RMJ4_ARAVE|nr:hypothetical protein AVEN_128781-1 [Araneus ventricosus]